MNAIFKGLRIVFVEGYRPCVRALSRGRSIDGYWHHCGFGLRCYDARGANHDAQDNQRAFDRLL